MKRVTLDGTWFANWGKVLFSPIKKEITRLKLRRRGSFHGSTWFSLAIRPFLEKDRVKVLLVAPVFASVIGVGVNQLPDTSGVSEAWASEQTIQTVMTYEVKVPTEGDKVTYLIPVEQLNGVSQSYHAGHPGIDLMAPLNSPVIAMERGVVTDIERDTFGYGKHVYVEHLYDLTSMYAHLNQIHVRVGQEIKSGQTVGTIGLTGWSTGPHLHFEVYEAETRVNPMKYIGEPLKLAKENNQISDQ